MTDRTWHKGPPPHVGWWVANTMRDIGLWRWWDGDRWSEPIIESANASEIASLRMHELFIPGGQIEWTDYWPENARVPRVDPRQPEQKPNYVCDRITLEYKAIALLQEANRLGFNLTIENKPLKPLAMGHTMSAVCVWPKRGTA